MYRPDLVIPWTLQHLVHEIKTKALCINCSSDFQILHPSKIYSGQNASVTLYCVLYCKMSSKPKAFLFLISYHITFSVLAQTLSGTYVNTTGPRGFRANILPISGRLLVSVYVQQFCELLDCRKFL